MIRYKAEFDPAKDVILNTGSLADRWQMHPNRAKIRAKQLGIPILWFNSRSCGWRLSDVLAAEERITVNSEVTA